MNRHDPKLRPKFDAATVEAEKNLEQRGFRKGRRGYARLLSVEEDAILMRQYGIKRRSFQELNPEIRGY